MNMSTKKRSDNDIEHFLSKLQSKHPDFQTKLFGSYTSSSNSSNTNDNVKKRRATLISHGNEALRILKSKRVYLGSKDNQMTRAALVIDYLLRNVRSNNDTNNSSRRMYFRSSIPMSILMPIIGGTNQPKKDFEQMQMLLGSYLDKTVIATKIASGGGDSSSSSNKQNAERNLRKRNADGTAASTTTNSSVNEYAAAAAAALAPTGLIRDLCINLGPLIPDAEFVFKFATKLFNVLANNVSSSKKKNNNNKSSSSSSQRERLEQNWLRKDMARFLECYEGACFYLAVKESEGASYNDVLKKKASAKITLKNQQKKEGVKKKSNTDGSSGRREDGGPQNNNNDGDQEDDDEDDTDDDRPMNEMDVVLAACLSESTFKTVLVYVKKYAQDIVISLDDTTTDQKKPSAMKNGGSANKKDSGADNRFRFGGRSVIVESSISNGKSRRRSGNYNAEFEQWKQQVLDTTMTKMQTKRKESGDKNNVSREETLKYAAEEVVQGLIHMH